MHSSRNLIDDVLTKIAENISPDNIVWDGILEICCAINAKDMPTALLALAETLTVFISRNSRLMLPIEVNYLREMMCCLSAEKLDKYEEIRLAFCSANLLERENKSELAIKAYKAIVDTRYYGLAYEFLLPLLYKYASVQESAYYSSKMENGLAVEHDERYRPRKAFLDDYYMQRMIALVREMGAASKNKSTLFTRSYNVHAKPFVPPLDLSKVI